jgi:hypothetical protein
MNKRRWASGVNILAVIAFSLSLFLADYATAGQESAVVEIKGKVKAVSNKAKTLSVTVKGKGVVMLKFNDATEFVNFKKTKEIKPPTAVLVKYKTVGPDNIATYIKKALVKLPAGVKEIKTEELAALVAKGPLAGNYCLIDARPAKIASAAHIPTAVSIPVNVLKEKGEKLLPCDKDKLIIFYCGGPT